MGIKMAFLLPTQNHHPYDISMPLAGVGYMPDDILAAKYELTDANEPEDMLNEHLRGILKDRRPDAPLFEHEMPNRHATARSGALNIRYEGHRGEGDQPNNREAFLGFAGPEEIDERGLDPNANFRHMVEQSKSRARFVRKHGEGGDTITGGYLAEHEVDKARKYIVEYAKKNWKILDDSKGNRLTKQAQARNLRPRQINTRLTKAKKQLRENEENLLPSSRNIITKRRIRNNKYYRANTNDTDLYDGEGALVYQAQNKKLTGRADNTVLDGYQSSAFAENDPRVKQIAHLMAKKTKVMRKAQTDTDTHNSTVNDRQVAQLARNIITRPINTRFDDDAHTIEAESSNKSAAELKRREHYFVMDGEVITELDELASLMRLNARREKGGDLRNDTRLDGKRELVEALSANKSSLYKKIQKRVNNGVEDQDSQELQVKIFNYKTKRPELAKMVNHSKTTQALGDEKYGRVVSSQTKSRHDLTTRKNTHIGIEAAEEFDTVRAPVKKMNKNSIVRGELEF